MNQPPQFERLLAKSCPLENIPWEATLLGHSQLAHQCAEMLVQTTGEAQLKALGLDAKRYWEPLRRIVTVAAAIHDLGKANDHFLGMLYGGRHFVLHQGIRHEWLTYYLFTTEPWQSWLTQALDGEEKFRFIALWCVSGHHPAPGRPSPPDQAPGGSGTHLWLLLEHKDFRQVIAWMEKLWNLPPLPGTVFRNQKLSLLSTGELFTHLRKRLIQDRIRWKQWQTTAPELRKLTAAAKACLIGADIAASILAKGNQTCTIKQIGQWLSNSLPSSEDLKKLIQDRLGGQSLRGFQVRTGASSQRVTLLQAGCGTGKTIAAYHWAATQCPGKRLYLCYPTTGTATEGFRDYLFDPESKRGKFGAHLFHSRAQADWELLLGARGEEDEAEQEVRLASLQAWFTPVVCCTVDTVLGLLQNQRRGLYAWPALAQAAFVFDEIHAYDQRLFGTLLRFLRELRGVPVLLMTASLPQERLKALQRTLGEHGEQLHQICGPQDLETLPRYRLECVPGKVEQRVRDELAQGGKVLWICNTVDRALTVAEQMANCRPLVYHSRFRYCDRVARHQEMIAAFKPERVEPALAVCTQVAEMSLDISATLLVTELAPVPALIQRLGRLNRFARPNQPPRPFVVVEPLDEQGNFSATPYGEDSDQYGPWPQQAREWLKRLGSGPLSQRDLAKAWEETAVTGPPRPHPSLWLDGGPRTLVDTIRDPSPGLLVLLEQDTEPVKRDAKELIKRVLPMPPPPKSFSWKEWDRLRGVRVVPEQYILYDPKRGAQWRKNEKPM